MFYKEIALYHEGHHHDHDHVHTDCGCGCHTHEEEMSKDEKTLNILLVHWVNHNQSHEEGFREWVEKAKEMGKDETAQYIEKAIEYMQKANDMLTEAKNICNHNKAKEIIIFFALNLCKKGVDRNERWTCSFTLLSSWQ